MRRFRAPLELKRLETLIRDNRGSHQLPAKLNLLVLSEGDPIPQEYSLTGDAIPGDQWGKVINWCIVLSED